MSFTNTLKSNALMTPSTYMALTHSATIGKQNAIKVTLTSAFCGGVALSKVVRE